MNTSLKTSSSAFQVILPYLKLVRAPAGITALTNILAAATIASAGQLSFHLLYLISASLCLYFSGMALNDCFDYEEDKRERANRPLVSGQIQLKQAWLFGLSLAALGVLLAFMYSALSGFVAIALSVAIVVYNGLIKSGFAGACTMASCRYINWILGASFVGISTEFWLFALPIFFYIAALTYLSKQETQAEDKKAIFVTAFLLLLTVASLIYLVTHGLYLQGLDLNIALGIITILTCLICYKLMTLFGQFTPANIQKMISWMIMGVIPLDATLLAISGHYITALIVLALLPPCKILNKYLAMT